jgi:hypothetical protein
MQRYATRGPTSRDSPELRRFVHDAAALGFRVVGAQVPAWNEADLGLLAPPGPDGKEATPTPTPRALCTAADILLLGPSPGNGKPTLAVVECKSGYVGPGLDFVIKGRQKFATAVGPFEGETGHSRTPVTHALHHGIQAVATTQLLKQTYSFLGRFDVQTYVCYVDRIPPPPCRPTEAPSSLQCEWRRVDSTPWARPSLLPSLLTTARSASPKAPRAWTPRKWTRRKKRASRA